MALPKGMRSGWHFGSIHDGGRHIESGSESDIARAAFEPGAGEQRPHVSAPPPEGSQEAEIWQRCWED